MKPTRITKLPSAADVPSAEGAILEFWDRNDVFARSIESRSESQAFVFYEGPPTANGQPGVHHVLARLCKDLVCRYKSMQGHRVVRKAGWDTHGLPVEIEVENQLGIEHKEQIEEYGVAEFNARCRESVFRYERDWVEFTRRIGYWLDMDRPYVTCDNDYIESVWWIIRQFWDAGLLYEGHKIVPYCPRCETSLSSHEVSQGYRDVSDPSIFVRFKRADADEYFLVWTTTPWTLVSNVALAVGPTHDYARVAHEGRTLILAEALLGVLEGEYEVLDRVKGADLAGATYEPLFDFFEGEPGAFCVHSADFVSLEDGTGIVHIAPAFGEDDYKLHIEHGVPLVQPVTPRGTFEDSVTPWAEQRVKDADPSIIERLKEEGKLYKSLKVEHSYPFCWRCSTALIYYARKSWYIKTTSFRDRMIQANGQVNWIPREVGDYRFGNWLENNVDWSLSRERYWGTPLNIWVCADCGHRHAVGSVEELRRMATPPPRDTGEIDLHRPVVDLLDLDCPVCDGGTMRRVGEVIDVWFDSGSMPFAQYHYPFADDGMFERQFPGDFISEGIDQSRGWFYSLLAISTFLTGKSPYKNVLCTELILDKHGQKMSKSRGNAVAPGDLLDNEGADALRWYLLTTSPPWVPTRFDRKGVVESSQKLLGTLRNVYSFYALYADIDGYEYSEDGEGANLLDRWILSRFHTVVRETTELFDAFDMTRAARGIQQFVLDELSNWYVRRSRRRFWKGEMGADKSAAYHTLHTVLDGVARLLAPCTPFLAEEVFLALRHIGAGAESRESVHLQDFPRSDPARVDEALETCMSMAVTLASLGRTARNEAGARIRQPLARLLVYSDQSALSELLDEPEILGIVKDELNIREIVRVDDIESYASIQAAPNFPALGKRFGKRVPAVADAIRSLTPESLKSFVRTGEASVELDGASIGLTRDELTVRVSGIEGFAAASDRGVTAALDLAITDELRLEGLAREIVNRVQNLRKRAGFDVTDRVEIEYEKSAPLSRVFEACGELIRGETLADSVAAGSPGWEHQTSFQVDGDSFRLWIRRVG